MHNLRNDFATLCMNSLSNFAPFFLLFGGGDAGLPQKRTVDVFKECTLGNNQAVVCPLFVIFDVHIGRNTVLSRA